MKGHLDERKQGRSILQMFLKIIIKVFFYLYV